jgi:hypothetical protein
MLCVCVRQVKNKNHPKLGNFLFLFLLVEIETRLTQQLLTRPTQDFPWYGRRLVVCVAINRDTATVRP